MLGALTLAACSGKVVTDSGGTGGTGGSLSSSSSTTTSSTGGPGPTGCPAQEPVGGSMCPTPLLLCTYGDAVKPECRHAYQCLGSGWQPQTSSCVEPADCSFASPDQVCMVNGETCTVGNSICTCTSCAFGPCMAPPPKWSCAGPPATPGCPPTIPNIGTACATPDLQCIYGNPCVGSGAIAECKSGAWDWAGPVACPD